MDVPGLVKSVRFQSSFIRRPLRGRWPSRFSWSVDRMIWRWSPTTFQHPLPWTRHLFQASPVPSRAQLGGRGAGETIFSWNIRVPQNDRTQCFQDTMDWYYFHLSSPFPCNHFDLFWGYQVQSLLEELECEKSFYNEAWSPVHPDFMWLGWQGCITA